MNPHAETWTSEMNRRRCELIDQKYDRGLNRDELTELAELQTAMHSYIDTVAPRPIEALRKLHEELSESLRNSQGEAV